MYTTTSARLSAETTIDIDPPRQALDAQPMPPIPWHIRFDRYERADLVIAADTADLVRLRDEIAAALEAHEADA